MRIPLLSTIPAVEISTSTGAEEEAAAFGNAYTPSENSPRMIYLPATISDAEVTNTANADSSADAVRWVRVTVFSTPELLRTVKITSTGSAPSLAG